MTALLLLSSGFAGFSQTHKDAVLLSQLKTPSDKRIMVAAHRGDWRNAPENSLKAYEYAINLGVDIIEVDLNISKDGVLIIMHDNTLDRTTNGRGRPSDYTLEELKRLHLKNGLGILTAHTIPTLEEVMKLAKGKVLVNLDKSYDYYVEAYGVLKQTGTVRQGIFKADKNYKEVVNRYPMLMDSILFMPVVNLGKPEAATVIKDFQDHLKPVAFELIFEKDTSALLSKLDLIKKKGARIWINSLWASLNGGHYDDLAVDDHNTRDSWDWLIQHGANILQTDRPKEMLLYLKKNKLR